MGILQARILEWVAIPSSRGCSQPRDRTQVSRIAGGFFTAELPDIPKEFMTQFKCDLDVFPVLFPNKHTVLPLHLTCVILHCPYT